MFRSKKQPAPARPSTLARQPTAAVDPMVLQTYRWLLATLGAFGLITVGFYLSIYYLQSPVPQLRLAALLVGCAVLLAPVVYLIVRGGHLTIAGIVTMIGALTGYGVNEVIWEGLTPYHIVGGTLLVLISGPLVFPRRRWVWLIWVGVYYGYLAIVNLARPLPRFDYTDLPVLFPYAIGANLLLILAVFLQLIQIVRTRTIRWRLLTAFMLVAFFPTVATGAIASYRSVLNAQDQIYNQLESVAALKEIQIQDWAGSLYTNMLLSTPRPEDDWLVSTLLREPGPLEQEFYKITQNDFRAGFQKIIDQTGVLEEIFIMDPQGKVLVSTNLTLEGTIKGAPYLEGDTRQFRIAPPFRSPDANRLMIVAVLPFTDRTGRVIALLAGQANLDKLDAIMTQRSGLGQTGETYLLTQQYDILTKPRDETYEGKSGYASAFVDAVNTQSTGHGQYKNFRGAYAYGVYRWIPVFETLLVAEQERAEVLLPITNTVYSTIGVMVISVILAAIASLLATRRITTPLNNLALTAERIAAGELQIEAKIEQEDEIGTLARSFNSMTAQLRTIVSNLEQRFANRTSEMQEQSQQLQAAAEVAREATAVRDLDELLNKAVHLVSDRFGFYHAGLFMVDERNEYAILRAASSEGGQEMLQRGHRLKVGETGIVGYVTQSGLPRIALDVGADAVYFKNPLLPETRSEVALPLLIGRRVIGALDVQSTREAAFNDTNIKVLQTMADQLAIAIENARLFREMEQTLTELEAVQGRYTIESWAAYKERAAKGMDYRYRGTTIEAVTNRRPEAQEAFKQGRSILIKVPASFEAGKTDETVALAVPMRLRGQVIGVLNFQFESATISSDIIVTLEEVASRLALVLENARLLSDAQRLALQEQQINIISTQVRRSASLDAILQNTVRELGKAMGASRTFIQFGIEPLKASSSQPNEDPNGHS